jgi:hypothetical protein
VFRGRVKFRVEIPPRVRAQVLRDSEVSLVRMRETDGHDKEGSTVRQAEILTHRGVSGSQRWFSKRSLDDVLTGAEREYVGHAEALKREGRLTYRC